MWIRNEWYWVEDEPGDGQWLQSRNNACIINKPESDLLVEEIMKAWHHQWFVSLDLIMGIPDNPHGYLITWHKEVR